jgi:hypothetical protein
MPGVQPRPPDQPISLSLSKKQHLSLPSWLRYLGVGQLRLRGTLAVCCSAVHPPPHTYLHLICSRRGASGSSGSSMTGEVVRAFSVGTNSLASALSGVAIAGCSSAATPPHAHSQIQHTSPAPLQSVVRNPSSTSPGVHPSNLRAKNCCRCAWRLCRGESQCFLRAYAFRSSPVCPQTEPDEVYVGYYNWHACGLLARDPPPVDAASQHDNLG